MELEQLKYLWTEYDNQLEQTIKINKSLLKELNLGKVKSEFTSVLWSKSFEAFILMISIWFFGGIVYDNFTNLHVAIPLSLLVFFAIASYSALLRQIYLIVTIKYSDSVSLIQKKLTLLKLSIVQYMRFSFVSIPFYLAYTILFVKIYLGEFIALKAQDSFWILLNSWWFVIALILVTCIPLGIFIFKKFSYKNLSKGIVGFLFKDSGGKQITESLKFLEEIKEFSRDVRC